MTQRQEGLYRKDEGTVDAEGFIAPSIGLVEHAQYFTTAPDVLAKTRQLLDQDRLELPGAVIVWDETIGRRKGAKAVPGAWWAGNGRITLGLVFEGSAANTQQALATAIAATIEAISSFAPRQPVTHDGHGHVLIDGKLLGMLHHEVYHSHDLYVIRVNGTTDFSKAPADVQQNHHRLIDYIDPSQLPLGKPGTLPNTLALALMTAIPRHFGIS